jgi:transcriptional regulator with XRE-family HTH domain
MDRDPELSFTPEMGRAGRALLGISQAQLARQTHVSRLTIAYFERAARKPIPANLAVIRSALEAAGVAFVPGGAVLRDATTLSTTLALRNLSRFFTFSALPRRVFSNSASNTYRFLVPQHAAPSALTATSICFPTSTRNDAWTYSTTQK